MGGAVMFTCTPKMGQTRDSGSIGSILTCVRCVARLLCLASMDARHECCATLASHGSVFLCVGFERHAGDMPCA
jgi:hypothetical protein